MINRSVDVNEGAWTWSGVALYEEDNWSGKWIRVRPDHYGIHMRRGSSAKDYSNNWCWVRAENVAFRREE